MNHDAKNPQVYCLPIMNTSSRHQQDQKTSSKRKKDLLSATTIALSRTYDDDKNDAHLHFPCRARGLHYESGGSGTILVPPNAEHGLLLRCSNDECAASGRKFRWCAVCHTVAAKRNFWQRHGHSFKKKQMPNYYQRKKSKNDDFVSSSSIRHEMTHKLNQSEDVASIVLKVLSVPLPDVAISIAKANSRHLPSLLTKLDVRPETSSSTSPSGSTEDGDALSLFNFGDDNSGGEWSDGEMEGLFEDM